MDERAAALPILGGGLGVDDQRVGGGSFEDAVGSACQGVGGDGIGVRELVGGVEVVVVLSRVPARLRESIVNKHSASTRYEGRYPSEDLPALSVVVKPRYTNSRKKRALCEQPQP